MFARRLVLVLVSLTATACEAVHIVEWGDTEVFNGSVVEDLLARGVTEPRLLTVTLVDGKEISAYTPGVVEAQSGVRVAVPTTRASSSLQRDLPVAEQWTLTADAAAWNFDVLLFLDGKRLQFTVQQDPSLSPDNDGDGFAAAEDCNDNDPAVFPGALEVCNERDDNCNGEIDEGVTRVFYVDLDGDTYGHPLESVLACARPEGYADNPLDCNDDDSLIYPGAYDTVHDAEDSDCDGLHCETGRVGDARFGLCFGSFVWAEAAALCQTGWSGMASIRAADEQAAVQALMVAAAMPYALIGLSDTSVEGAFSWTDGAPLGYANWGDGEPNDSGDGEDCGAIQGSLGYTWNDVPCDLYTESAVLCGDRG